MHDTAPSPAILCVGLALVGLQQVVTGAWALLAPAGFYAVVPTVDVVPPFNEHLVRDVGAALLATVPVIAAALWRRSPGVAAVALTCVLTFAVPHALFHLAHGSGRLLDGAVLLKRRPPC